MGFLGKTFEFGIKAAGVVVKAGTFVTAEVIAIGSDISGNPNAAQTVRSGGKTIGNAIASGANKVAVVSGKAIDLSVDAGSAIGGSIGANIAQSKGKDISAGQKIGTIVGGAVAGVAVGLVATTAAVVTVGAVGTAGTGTAIAGLAGAAKTGATLAAIGGGSLAAGGGGIAAGTAIITGANIVAGAVGASDGYKKTKNN